MITLDLERSSVFSKSIMAVISQGESPPLTINAGNNLIQSSGLLNITGYRRAGMEELVRWNGKENLYRMDRAFILTSRPLRANATLLPTNLAKWTDMPSVTEDGSVESKHDFRASFPFEVNLLEIEPEEYLNQDYAKILEGEDRGYKLAASPGPDPGLIGPGNAYHEFRQTPEYEAWSKRVREACLAK